MGTLSSKRFPDSIWKGQVCVDKAQQVFRCWLKWSNIFALLFVQRCMNNRVVKPITAFNGVLISCSIANELVFYFKERSTISLATIGAWLSAANEMVRTLLKSKDQFISNMSHEIRTPLNAVIGFTTCYSIQRWTKSRANIWDHSISIWKPAGLINNILDLSKIESGNLLLESVPMDVNKF